MRYHTKYHICQIMGQNASQKRISSAVHTQRLISIFFAPKIFKIWAKVKTKYGK